MRKLLILGIACMALSCNSKKTVGNKYVSDMISDNVVFTTTLEVQDHIFYKTINIRLLNTKIATCVFGKIFIHDVTGNS